MTTRERWIIYPLLFLSLGIGLRPKLTSQLSVANLQCDTLHCERLVMDGPDRVPRVHLQAVGLPNSPRTQGGSLIMTDPAGRPHILFHCEGSAGAMETVTAKGLPQVRIDSTSRGGLVSMIDNQGRVIFDAGHRPDESGIFAAVDLNQRKIIATVPFLPRVAPKTPADHTEVTPPLAPHPHPDDERKPDRTQHTEAPTTPQPQSEIQPSKETQPPEDPQP